MILFCVLIVCILLYYDVPKISQTIDLSFGKGFLLCNNLFIYISSLPHYNILFPLKYWLSSKVFSRFCVAKKLRQPTFGVELVRTWSLNLRETFTFAKGLFCPPKSMNHQVIQAKQKCLVREVKSLYRVQKQFIIYDSLVNNKDTRNGRHHPCGDLGSK